MTLNLSAIALALSVALPAIGLAAPAKLTVKAVNPLPLARVSEILELSARELAPLGETNLARLHVQDAAGQELLCQAVDVDFDAYHRPDVIAFQSDFAPGETKTFTVTVGAKQTYKKDQFRAHGRFVRERFDDFAWENDRIAHRMYGKRLETWAGEPLTSSTVDIWSKRVPQMIVDDWYLVDNYHADTGTGADFYSAGLSRGCGGNGLWAADKLWVSKNFTESRVLANGPIRVCFELVYDAFDANGVKVSEVKRITLDAGSQLDRFRTSYHPEATASPLVSAIGLKKTSGAQKDFSAATASLTIWEKVAKNAGNQGLAVVLDPKSLAGEAGDKLNHLLLAQCGADHSVTYWAGFCWDRAGQFTDYAAWQRYVAEFVQRLAAPIQLTVSAE